MRVEIKRFDKELPLPKYQTAGAAGFDFYLRNDAVLKPGEFKYLPTGVGLKIPEGYFLLVNSRGSTYNRHKILVIPGIGDVDFCGEKDEYHIQAVNLGQEVVRLEKGARIAQGILVKIAVAEFVEVNKMGTNRPEDKDNNSRGGFGTTG